MSEAQVLNLPISKPVPRRDVVESLLAPERTTSTAPLRLHVALVWGRDHLLDVREVREGAALTVRHGALAIAKAQETGPILRSTAEGFVVELPERTRALVVGDDGRQWLEGGRTHVLPRASRVCIEVGNVRLVARCAPVQPLRARALTAMLDLEFLTTLVVLALAAITFERMTQVAGPTSRDLGDDGLRNLTHYRAHTVVAEPKKPEKVFKPALSGAKPVGLEGRVGRLEARPRDAARGKAGVDTGKRAADLAKVQKLLAWLDGPGPGADQVFGKGGLGGINNAMGGIKAAGALGDAAGVGGLGTRGGDKGGGGDAIRIGGLGPKGDGPGDHGIDIGKGLTHPPFIPPRAERTILGPGLTAEEVDRVVRRHWNEIRYCYEKELQRDPNLDGKVGTYFEIGPVGGVTIANVAESTIGSPEVESCIVGKVKLWQFPQPRGGGVVQVRYPFLFRAH